MGLKDIKKGVADWDKSGANDSKDKELSEDNHNRNFDPSTEAERAGIAEKLNGDCGKMRTPYQIGQ